MGATGHAERVAGELAGWGQSSRTRDGKPAPLALDFLNATASEAGSLLDDAKAVNSNKTEQATELHWALFVELRRLTETLSEGEVVLDPELGPLFLEERFEVGRVVGFETG